MNGYFIFVLVTTSLLIAWLVYNIMKDTLGKKAKDQLKDEEEFAAYDQEPTQVRMNANGEGYTMLSGSQREDEAIVSSNVRQAVPAEEQSEAQPLPEDNVTAQSDSPEELKVTPEITEGHEAETADEPVEYTESQAQALEHFEEISDSCEAATMYEGEMWASEFADMAARAIAGGLK